MKIILQDLDALLSEQQTNIGFCSSARLDVVFQIEIFQ